MLGEDFDEDAGGAPDVDRRSVLRFAEKKLWAAVPYGDDSVCVIELPTFGEETGETEIREFELARAADEDVGGFDVAMEHATAVEVVETFEELLCEVLLVRVSEPEIRMVEETGQIVRYVFEDHEAIVLLDHHLLQFHDVLVVEGLEQLDLANGCDGELGTVSV